ncbi:MAG: hypothetical protein KatS3mg113_0729 [Planctomycetaceae bacterium]|nr:MAG: hypothetical protein KatS3mg113_0729 [Planctomycetaceae bacterium]
MTFLGKILIVLQLGLTLMFMALAGAVFTTHNNWKTRYEESRKALDAAQAKSATELNALQTQLDQLQQRFNDLQNEKITLEGKVTTLTQDNLRLDQDNKNLKIQLDSAKVNVQLAASEAEERNAESKLQRARNAELNQNRNQILDELNAERDKVFALELELEQIKQKESQLLRDLATMRTFLSARGLPSDPQQMLLGQSPPPPIDGKVLDTLTSRGQRLYVEVSLGTDDGLQIGHEMTVFNNSKYKGRIRIESVYPDRAVGVVVDKAPNSVIEKGDYVSTRL